MAATTSDRPIVLVTGPGFDLDGERTGVLLRQEGLVVRHEPKTGNRTAEQLSMLLDGAVAAIASTDPFTSDVFVAHPQLRVIARTGVGVDSIDMDAATEAGVLVTTTPGLNHETVADHALALMLACIRRLREHDQSMRLRRWERGGAITPRDLHSSTVGLVGSGRIGQAVVRRLRGFGCTILVSDPALTEPLDGTRLVGLDELLQESDVVSVHAPLLPTTAGLIGRREIALMRSTAILVNPSRGHIVEEAALIEALRTGRLAGAAIDAFEHEPPFESAMFDPSVTALPNVIFSPHVGGLSVGSLAAMTEMASRSVVETLRGELPSGAVNPAALEFR